MSVGYWKEKSNLEAAIRIELMNKAFAVPYNLFLPAALQCSVLISITKFKNQYHCISTRITVYIR